MDRLKEWLRPGTTQRDVVTTWLYLVLLSPAVFVAALHRHLSAPVVALLLCVAAIPLLFRSRWPLGTVIASAAVTVVAIAITGVPSVPPIAFAITLYSFAKRSDRRTTVRVGVAAAVTITTLALILRPSMDALGENLGVIAWIGLAVAIGDAARSRRELLASAMERAERAERTKEEEARRRVTEERMRIARELHDVVAHHITLVNAQAGVAHHLMKTDPSHAYEALERIRDTSRSALDELRATVGLLRANDETAPPREPAPGLADLPTLVESFRHAGLEVTMEAPQTAPAIPALTELTVYRIVQEALTNTHKHAGRHATAQVHITLTPATVRITVLDDGGRGPARTGLGTGHGMIGMQERVKAAGGTFTATPDRTGGFRVEAELPTGATTRPAGGPAPIEAAAGTHASIAAASSSATNQGTAAPPEPGVAQTETAGRQLASATAASSQSKTTASPSEPGSTSADASARTHASIAAASSPATSKPTAAPPEPGMAQTEAAGQQLPSLAASPTAAAPAPVPASPSTSACAPPVTTTPAGADLAVGSAESPAAAGAAA